MQNGFQMLLHGYDTVQVAYSLFPRGRERIDFDLLAKERERVRTSRRKDPVAIKLGDEEFLLEGHGSASGYPFIMTNSRFRIEFGEFNTPNFFITFQSQALWSESAAALHERFLQWAGSVGYSPSRDERLSRVDFAFDYHLPELDFDETNFVSRSTKDSKYRENGKLQSLTFGRDRIVMRFYDKVAEIRQQSGKVWFYELWKQEKDVWRVEWQVRKDALKEFGIRTFGDLEARKGDLLSYLVGEHDTLRVRTADSNPSRWPLHPVWEDLLRQIEEFGCSGAGKFDGMAVVLEERLIRMAISIYGYMKRVAAIQCVQEDKEEVHPSEALEIIKKRILRLHEPLSWECDVDKRTKEIRLGRW
jgi:hypothetical protein